QLAQAGPELIAGGDGLDVVRVHDRSLNGVGRNYPLGSPPVVAGRGLSYGLPFARAARASPPFGGARDLPTGPKVPVVRTRGMAIQARPQGRAPALPEPRNGGIHPCP